MFNSSEDIVRFIQEKKVTMKNSFDFIDIEKTLITLAQSEFSNFILFKLENRSNYSLTSRGISARSTRFTGEFSDCESFLECLIEDLWISS